MLAPNQVRTPAATQTSSMPAKLGTARLTSEGCTKIDEPTMVPTTIEVACVSPIDRWRVGATFCRCSRSAEAVALHRAEMLSPRSATASAERPIDLQDRGNGVGVGCRLVGPIPFDAREAQRHTPRILRARLNLVERDLCHHFRPDVDGVVVAADLELEELLR